MNLIVNRVFPLFSLSILGAHRPTPIFGNTQMGYDDEDDNDDDPMKKKELCFLPNFQQG